MLVERLSFVGATRAALIGPELHAILLEALGRGVLLESCWSHAAGAALARRTGGVAGPY